MEPQCHLSTTEGIGKAFAEAQLPALDDLAAAAAPGATARSGYEEVSHDGKHTSDGRRSTSPLSSRSNEFECCPAIADDFDAALATSRPQGRHVNISFS